MLADTQELSLLPSASPLPTSPNIESLKECVRSIAFKTASKSHLCSSNNKDLNASYPSVVKAKAPVDLPDQTVIDGEVAALDEAGRVAGPLQEHWVEPAATSFWGTLAPAVAFF